MIVGFLCSKTAKFDIHVFILDKHSSAAAISQGICTVYGLKTSLGFGYERASCTWLDSLIEKGLKKHAQRILTTSDGWPLLSSSCMFA